MKDHMVSPMALAFMEKSHRGKGFIQPKCVQICVNVSSKLQRVYE